MLSDVISQSHMFLSKFHVFFKALTLILNIIQFDGYIGENGNDRTRHNYNKRLIIVSLENRLKPNKYALN